MAELKKGEIFGGVILFLVGGATVLFSLRMDLGTFRAAGTGLFPLSLGILLMILSGAFVIKQLLLASKGIKRDAVSEETSPSAKRMVIFLGILVLMVFFLSHLGYPLSTFILMVSLLWLLGVRPWALNVLISCFTAIVSYGLFVWWLKIPLPKGWIGL